MTRRIQRKNESPVHKNGGTDKDQLLCELKIQKTQAELKFRALRAAHDELEISRNRFAQLYDSAPNAYVTFDEKAEIRWLNLMAAELAGMPREQVVGLPFTVFFAREDLSRFFSHLRRCRGSSGEKIETEVNFLAKNNKKIPMQLLSVGVRDAGEVLFQTTLIDIRSHKIAERMFLEAKEYSDRIIETINQPLLVLDENLVITLANPSFYRVFKLSPKEVNGRRFQYFEGSNSETVRLRGLLQNVIEKKKGFENFEFNTGASADRPQIIVLSAQPLLSKAHFSPQILLSLDDITERHEAEVVREHLVGELGKLAHELEDRVNDRTRELQQANAKLKILSARLLETQELERRHLARELHDEIGQQITCLRILTENQSALAPPSLKRSLKETRKATNELLQTVRQLSAELRPQLLDDFGALAALEWHFKRFRKRTGINVRLHKKYFQEILLNSFIRNVLFRVAQESLTNVARHAHTNKVDVRLSTRNAVCKLEVIDKGSGFHVKKALQKGSFGLTGMQERVFLAGGNLKIESAPGKGTTVSLELPLVSPQMNAFDPDHLMDPSNDH